MPALDTVTLRAARDLVVKAHIEAETETHDIAAALATFHHARYEVPALSAIADGPAAVEDLLGQLFGAFPDFWLRRLVSYHADDAVIVECRMGGTHRGVWGGIAPTGNRIDVPAALIFIFEGENLVCEKVYFDHATILHQLGALT
ncbi:MAG: ester cyclase [Acidobacteriaceae bacterium]|nr:ester cyclase [Acidobacteriaceae bacterium]